MSNIKPTAKSIIIDAIDEQIRQYEELIGQLEQEKKHYIDSNPIIPEVKKINKTTISPGQQVIMLKSTFLRLVEALAQMPDLFTRIQIKAGAELDGLGIIKEGTFAPAFSKLIKRKHIAEVGKGSAGKPGTYKRAITVDSNKKVGED